MAKKLIQKYIPNPKKIKNIKGIGVLSQWLGDPNLWHIHRHNTAKSFSIGLFWMAIPMPFQMISAAICAILIRANLPLSIALVWISNPFTMAPIFYFNYRVGSYLLGFNPDASLSFEMSWHWLTHTLGDLWVPLFAGSFLVGSTLAITSYFSLHLFWRFNVVSRWKTRKNKRN